MAAFLITFSLKPSKDIAQRYLEVTEKLGRKFGRKIRQINRNTYIVSTDSHTPSDLRNMVDGFDPDRKCAVLVVDISLCGWASHDIDSETCRWLESNI